MMFLLQILAALALFSILYLLHALAQLSKRFGSVLKMPPHYRWLYVSQGLAGLGLFAYFAGMTLQPNPTGQVLGMNVDLYQLIFSLLPLSMATTLALAIIWKYWGWLIREQDH